jgi:DNA-binding CsgD family transcriptional regulator
MAMIRHALIYGIGFALCALVLAWLDFRHFTFRYSTEVYIFIIALLFAILGAWVGNYLLPPKKHTDFALNQKAIDSLGISARELEVLAHLAIGSSNKLIARKLDISPNTVKTHTKNLYEKLCAQNRTEATQKARELQILP